MAKDFRQTEIEMQIKDGIWLPKIFADFKDELICAASTKQLGAGFTNLRGRELLKTEPEVLVKFCQSIDPKIDPDEVVLLNFSYDDKIAVVDENIIVDYRNRQNKLIGTDGAVSNLSGSTIMFLVADCVPTAVYDPKNKAMGIFHSSWHTIAKNMVGKGVDKMAQEFGSQSENLLVAVGPAYSANYEVKDDVRQAFIAGNYFTKQEIDQFFTKTDADYFHLDLYAAVKTQLLHAGILEKNLEISNLRTDLDNAIFPSFRLEGEKSDRIAFIMHLKS